MLKLTGTAAALLVSFLPLQAGAFTAITISTGSTSGVYYPAGQAICAAVNKNTRKHGIECRAIPSKGSAENIRRIQNGEADFGIVQSDAQYYAVKGFGPYKKFGPDDSLRAALALHNEAFTIVARKDAGIHHLRDLKGKRVDVGHPNSGQYTDMKLMMGMRKWSFKDFAKVTKSDLQKQSELLCNNEIDAFVVTIGHMSDHIKDTSAKCDVEIVSAYDKLTLKLVEKFPYYSRLRIPADSYNGTPAPVPTFGVTATLMTSIRQSDRVVKRVIQSVFDDFIDFRFAHSAFFHLKPDDMVNYEHSAELHDGALKHFMNMGFNPSVDKVRAPR
ncbi:TAXI family TRAP transporter solute-binding subunit [Magnetovibrio sp. PR-2]|uniref:TAXI family TRAP transporter solute-binding subunit n=1 Tax=Magnetovibrio sp. PR-2 TaxID=3120356 RepID=UPI002FCE0E4B